MSSPRYDKGEWNAICDSCGRQVKSSELRKRWDGLMVCSKDWEPRHPQDFVRGITDIQAVPWSRPESSNNFVSPCTTRSSIAKYAVAGCMIAGNTTNPGIIPPSSFTV